MTAPVATVFATTLPDGRGQHISHYVFKTAGDELQLHDHEFFHSTSCLIGCCEVFGPNGPLVTVEAGFFTEIPAHRKHGIRALVDGTHILTLPEPGAFDGD